MLQRLDIHSATPYEDGAYSFLDLSSGVPTGRRLLPTALDGEQPGAAGAPAGGGGKRAMAGALVGGGLGAAVSYGACKKLAKDPSAMKCGAAAAAGGLVAGYAGMKVANATAQSAPLDPQQLTMILQLRDSPLFARIADKDEVERKITWRREIAAFLVNVPHPSHA
eukprot:gnl/TRDRNA2_/TRDRNA2_58658_c0_seq1.p1 gnl/TRDRNA2_/TRDRNA2_58658_c0~~gnl/TRDRNA2_/TRDRNA2_58658_c0_seq1.p1  ORF type:complete len:166 (+),score=23.74 gnl/TRDRNA2_/TRDRNA2_58658_c0_seq1:1-498(+)